MFKRRSFAVLGAVTVMASLAAGTSYAWFTAEDTADPVLLEAGYIRVELVGDSGDEVVLYPDEDASIINYTITNKSEVPAVAKFTPGKLTAYMLPQEYLDGGYVIRDVDARKALRELTDTQKMKEFYKTDAIDTDKVYFGPGGSQKWTLDTGCEYLTPGNNGEEYFLLTPGGSASCEFKIGLKDKAGNEYQYALFTVGPAEAISTQDTSAATTALRGVEQ